MTCCALQTASGKCLHRHLDLPTCRCIPKLGAVPGFAPPEPATLPEVRIPGTTPAPNPAPAPPPPEDNRHRRPPAPQVPKPGWNLLLYQLRMIGEAAQSLERQRQIYQNWIDGKGPYGETLPSPEVEVRRQMMETWGIDTPEDLEELLETLEDENQTTVDRPAERTDGNVEVTQDERRPDPCEIGPYSEMRLKCAARGAEAHHIVPDYTLRYGARPTSNLADTERIPGMPSLSDGNAICLSGAARVTGTEHHAAHNWTDVKIRQKGDANAALPGTTTLREVLVASYQGAALAKPGCETEIADAMTRQFGSLPQDALLRARMQPLPTGDTLKALQGGARLVNGQVTPPVRP
jgi:hypothetical protein